MTQSQALTILKTGANVFLTGGEPAITASTEIAEIAATHIDGMTIHS